MIKLSRGMIINVNLEPTLGSETGKTRPCLIVTNDIYNRKLPVIQVVPITEWSSKKDKIITNVSIIPDNKNGLLKKSIADCLQTRPIDRNHRLVGIRGNTSSEVMQKIDQALIILFELNS